MSIRNRPDIRLNPDPAGYPASISGSGSGFKNFAEFLPDISFLKFLDLEYFQSDSFSIRTSRIESSRFRARVAKDRPAFRDRITRGSLESKIGYRGVGVDFEKPKKIFG